MSSGINVSSLASSGEIKHRQRYEPTSLVKNCGNTMWPETITASALFSMNEAYLSTASGTRGGLHAVVSKGMRELE